MCTDLGEIFATWISDQWHNKSLDSAHQYTEKAAFSKANIFHSEKSWEREQNTKVINWSEEIYVESYLNIWYLAIL